MCGGGSISLEGAYSYPSCFHIGGDNHETAVEHSRENMQSMIDAKNVEKAKMYVHPLLPLITLKL